MIQLVNLASPSSEGSKVPPDSSSRLCTRDATSVLLRLQKSTKKLLRIVFMTRRGFLFYTILLFLRHRDCRTSNVHGPCISVPRRLPSLCRWCRSLSQRSQEVDGQLTINHNPLLSSMGTSKSTGLKKMVPNYTQGLVTKNEQKLVFFWPGTVSTHSDLPVLSFPLFCLLRWSLSPVIFQDLPFTRFPRGALATQDTCKSRKPKQ